MEPARIKDAIDSHPKGVIMRFEVVPGSKELRVPSGFNPWRASLEAKLTEKPTKGKANLQLTKELASIFGLSSSQIEVMSGHKSHRKVILISDLESEKAIEILAARLAER